MEDCRVFSGQAGSDNVLYLELRNTVQEDSVAKVDTDSSL